MRQFNLEADNGSPKTSQFTLPADEHFSILVRYRNWDDKQEWLGYTLADQSGNDVVKYRMEQPDDGVLYFCSSISASQKLHFANVSGESSYTPRDVIQMVALPASTQDNCYVCSADYARTAGEGGGGGGGVSQEYVDTKVQDEATAREAADERIRTYVDEVAQQIPTKVSQLDNDSGFLTYEGTIANADNANTAGTANTANSVEWHAVQNTPTDLAGYGITDAATKAEIPTKTSELQNDSGYLTEHQSLDEYYTKTQVDAKVQDEADARVTSYDELKASIPTKVSQLENDSGFLTYEGTIANADHANTANTANTADNVAWGNVSDKPTTLEGYGITDAATKAEIPTKTSQLDNDSGFLTHEGTIANAENANTASTADTANSVAWSGVQSKPTTLEGYGITDAATKTELDSLAAVVGNANTQLEEIA